MRSPFAFTWTLVALSLLGGAAGCSRHPVAPIVYGVPTFGAEDSVFTDQQLLAAAYSSYESPSGFYSEPRPAYAAPYYVNTLSILPLDARTDRCVELATEDTAQARAWAESTGANSSDPYFVEPGPPTVTLRYFEFSTHRSNRGPGVPMRSHRSGYFDRAGYDFFPRDSLVGRLDLRPVDLGSARGLAEYLWYLSYRDFYGYKPLSSFGRDRGDGVVHTIFEVSLVFGDFDVHDRVMLSRMDYRIDKASGAVVLRTTLLREVAGQQR